jgi:hypothetical protein
MRDRPFLLSGILGIGAILLTLALTVVGPRAAGALPAGFLTPVLAFEFAADAQEVEQIFGPPGEGREVAMASMDRVNRLDFVYIGLYGLTLFTFALTIARMTGRWYFYAAAVLALVVMAADVMENVQLLGITRSLGVASIEETLERLSFWTLVKWRGLALALLLLVPYFRREPGSASRLGRGLAWVLVLPAALAALSAISRGMVTELFALSIGLAFLLLTIYAWRASPHPVGDSGADPSFA